MTKNNLRRAASLALAAVLTLGLTACKPKTADLSVDDVEGALLDSQTGLPAMTAPAGDELTSYLTDGYGLDAALWESAAVSYAGGTQSDEVSVVLCKTEDDVSTVYSALQEYLRGRLGDFTGYLPEEAAQLENASVTARGRYVALLALPDNDKAQAAFDDILSAEAPPTDPPKQGVEYDAQGRVVFDPPNEYDMTIYDTSAILSAWRSGDKTGLTLRNKDILETAASVLDSIFTDGMTDYEKELAVHDWMLDWIEYDQSDVSFNPLDKPDPDNNNPYGPLMHQKGICLGYATTFQLLMDMTGIECITVVGASANSTSDHAWNMVKLDGEWYCVDTTWDDSLSTAAFDWKDPADRERVHLYFNVTTQTLLDSDHQWDYDNTPQATATQYAWADTGAPETK